ncbi:serine/threonine protein kinase, partial [Bifidobacterium leontopitheci]
SQAAGPYAPAPAPGMPPYGPAQPGPRPYPQQPQANPTLLKREALIRRGTPLTVACMAPVAILAAAMPLAGMMLACALCWLLLTLGYSADARLKREYRRGGRRTAGDTAMSVVTLPWHLLRGLAQAVPRTLLATAVLALGTTLFTLILGSPTINLGFSLFGIDVVLPVVATAAFSPAGLTIAASAAAGWASGMIAPAPTIMRLGAGAAMGAGSAVNELGGHVNPTLDNAMVGSTVGANRSGRAIVIWIIWGIITLSACVAVALGGGIDWWPLPYSVV